jgi:O-methyltransferase involved in polyketide biosynthesis
MVVRTAVMDEIILRTISEREIDTVLNLAAGLDTRPWRLRLPPTLRWIDVDLPAMLDWASFATNSPFAPTKACDST